MRKRTDPARCAHRHKNRSTCERLRHEKYLFVAGGGPYADAAKPEALLAERVEGLVSQEHAAWTSHREEASRRIAIGS